MKFKYKMLGVAIALALGSGSTAVMAEEPKPYTKPFLLSGTLQDRVIEVAGAGSAPFITLWDEDNFDYQKSTGTSTLYARYTANGSVAGGKFKIAGDLADEIGPLSAAMNPQGNAVACWSTAAESGDQISCQLIPHDTAANIVAAPIAVSTVDGYVNDVSVAMDDTGNFIVAWQLYDRNSKFSPVRARRFAANGTASAEAFEISPDSTSSHIDAAIDPDGDAGVAWAEDAIFVRRIAKGGSVPSAKFRVDTTPANDEDLSDKKGTLYTVGSPTIAMDAMGNFAIAWQRTQKDTKVKTNNAGVSTFSTGVYGQRFDVSGHSLNKNKKTGLTEDMTVRFGKKLSHLLPDIAMDPAGNFVVTWEQDLYKKYCFTNQGVNNCGEFWVGSHVYARKYDNLKNKLGATKTVVKKSRKSYYNVSPAVAMLDDGSFEVAWIGADYVDYYGSYTNSKATARFFPARKK